MDRKKRILAVDDEKNFLMLLKLNLEELGKYEVKTLYDATDILSVIKEFKPDLLVLDLIMPSVGGLEVCEILNNEPSARKIPIIILSALSKDADKLKAYKLGITDYLVKPLKTNDLIIAIEKCFKEREDLSKFPLDNKR